MTFERRETLFGIPVSRWSSIPTGHTEERFDGPDAFIGNRINKTMSVDVATYQPSDESSLTITSVTKIAESWTTHRSVLNKNEIHRGTSGKTRVFTTTPGHQLVYRWNSNK